MSKIKATSAEAPAADLGREFATAVILFHETLARRVGLSAAQSRCLGALWRLGPSTAGRLALATGLTTGAITGIVDKLERLGFARRIDNPEDRRSVIVVAETHPDLEEKLKPGYAALRAAMADLHAGFTDAENAAITKYLTGATATLRRLAGQLEP